MKLKSKYNVAIDNDDSYIIYNILHKKALRIPKFYNENESETVIEKLYTNNKLFNDNEEIEIKKRDFLFKSMLYQSTQLNITLMLTMNCNFKCVYCFESGNVNGFLNDICDEDKVVEWIIHLIKKYDIRKLDLCYHGGEPLLEIYKLKNISQRLIDFCEKNKVFYLFTIVTNGYLLNQENINILKESKVKIAQVTIDGPKEIHNERRPHKFNKDSFSAIINNIKNNLKDIKIYVNILYDKSNYEYLFNLFSFIKKEQLEKKIDLFLIDSVKPNCNLVSYNENNYEIEEESKVRLLLLEKMLELGFKIPFDLEYQLCTIKQKNSFVIIPNGDIYKCISGVGIDSFKISSIKNKIDPFETSAVLVEENLNDHCIKCKYMPICNGGCKYEDNLMGEKVCNRKFYDVYIKDYIKLIYKKDYFKYIVFENSGSDWEKLYV